METKELKNKIYNKFGDNIIYTIKLYNKIGETGAFSEKELTNIYNKLYTQILTKFDHCLKNMAQSIFSNDIKEATNAYNTFYAEIINTINHVCQKIEDEFGQNEMINKLYKDLNFKIRKSEIFIDNFLRQKFGSRISISRCKKITGDYADFTGKEKEWKNEND